MRSLEWYFGVSVPRCFVINIKIPLSWAHKQFGNLVHTLLCINALHDSTKTWLWYYDTKTKQNTLWTYFVRHCVYTLITPCMCATWCHCSNVIWVSWRLESTANWMFVQQFVQPNIRKIHITGPLGGGILVTGRFLSQGLVIRKCFM